MFCSNHVGILCFDINEKTRYCNRRIFDIPERNKTSFIDTLCCTISLIAGHVSFTGEVEVRSKRKRLNGNIMRYGNTSPDVLNTLENCIFSPSQMLSVLVGLRYIMF